MDAKKIEAAQATLRQLFKEKMAATRGSGSSFDEPTGWRAAQSQLEWDLEQERIAGDAESGELLTLMQTWGSDPAERARRLLDGLMKAGTGHAEDRSAEPTTKPKPAQPPRFQAGAAADALG